MSRTRYDDELGECQVGDIIVGRIYKYKLQIIAREYLYDDLYKYECVYLEGPREGETMFIESNFSYIKVMQ